MKKQLQLLIFLLPLTILSQTQLGSDIDGEDFNTYFGTSVSISGDGTVIAGGAPANSDNGPNAGHVRVYQYNGSAWVQLGGDIDGEASNDDSGRSVSLSDDGSIVAIGAPGNDGNGNGSGHVRVYQYSGGTWSQLGSNINGEAEFDRSGFTISLSASGSRIAIGANGNDGNGNASGHVRIYEYSGGSWSKLGADIDGEAAGDLSGTSVSLSNDGTTVAIGATENSGNGSKAGHVRVYQYSGGTWSQLGSDIDGETANDESGVSVSLSAEGSIVAIGAQFNTDNGSDAGHVRVYQYNGGTWSQLGSDIDGEANDQSGRSISLSADGSVVAIGAPVGEKTRVLQYTGSVWVQVGSDIEGEGSGDESGTSIGLSNDGTRLVIGAPNNFGWKGQARVFDLSILLSSNEYVLSQFSMYPNPVEHQFTIELKNDLELQKANVYNNLGQLINTATTPVISTYNFANGIYYVEIITNKGKATKKIAVKK